jgi:hypothetical protein
MAFDFTDPRLFGPRAELYALAFEEAGRALAGQRQLLADVRSRAGGVVATAALVASILGAAPMSDGHYRPAVYVAVAAFLGVGVSAFGLLWLGDLEMTIDPKALLWEYAEPSRLPLALVHRDLALHRAASLARNRRRIARMIVLLRMAVASLAIEVIAWLVNYVAAL